MHDHLGNYKPQGICAFSGFKVPADELVRNWDGQLVHRRFVDKRNPQDFVRGRRDDMRLNNASPESPDEFLGVTWLVNEDGEQLYSDDGFRLMAAYDPNTVTADDL